MKKRLTIITFCILVCSLIFTGCSNSPFSFSSEKQAYKKSIRKEYDGIARMRINEALTEKYEEKITITSLNIIANLDYSLGFGSEPYKKVATGKAKIGNDEFDIYLKWDINNEPSKFVCYDNREKEDILNDLEKYFANLYGHKPYAAYYEAFSSLGYEFDRKDGMIQEKYTGNIEDYMNEFSNLIKIVVAYDDLNTIFIEDTVNEFGEVIKGTPDVLLKAKNVYIINTFDDSLTEKNLKSIISELKINEFLPLINEYIQIEKGVAMKWSNNMTEFAEFTYKGSITDKSILVDDDCNLELKKWENLPIADFSEHKIVSDWYYTPEKNSAFYINEDFLDINASKYTVLFCHKNSKDNMNYSFKVIRSNDTGYLRVEPKQENTWFVICAKEDTTPEFIKKINEYYMNFIESV